MAHRVGALTLAHLRGSTDYRSCQHLAQRSVLAQSNSSPKTSVSTAVSTVLARPPGKTRVYLQKTGYTREIPGSASMPRAPYSEGPCANCGSHRLLKYAHRTMCARYRCQKAASALRQARLAGGGADDAVVPTFCFKIEAVLGMRFCEPEQLIAAVVRLEADLAAEVHALDWHPHLLAYHMRVHRRLALRAAMPASWINKERLGACGTRLPLARWLAVAVHRAAVSLRNLRRCGASVATLRVKRAAFGTLKRRNAFVGARLLTVTDGGSTPPEGRC